MEFNDKLIDNLNKIDIKISSEIADKFFLYMKELIDWNEKMNLTAIIEENDVILKHFVDSLTILKYIKNKESIIDIGTGAGFPGIPIKIVNENINLTLVDSLNKRVNFLKNIIQKLELNNIDAMHFRAEELAMQKKHRESYDICTSRAVANLSTLVEYMLPFVKVGGKCICMKGSEIEEELKESQKAIRELGGKVVKIDNIILPNSDYERNIIVIEKITHTKLKYPRKAGIPAKDPIK